MVLPPSVAITFDKNDLEATLDRAYELAVSGQPLPAQWLRRASEMEQPLSYVTALGAAMLAKATNDQAFSLSNKIDPAQPHSYMLRDVAEVMGRQQAAMGFDIGSKSKRNPLNSSNFHKGPARIDRFERPRYRLAFESLVRYLSDLNDLKHEDALLALAAWLRSRREYAAHRSSMLQAQLSSLSGTQPLADILRGSVAFVTEAPEDGARGQAFVAGVLDLVYPVVEMRAVNDPIPIDVAAGNESPPTQLACEVKQKPVTDGDVLGLAEEARSRGFERALYVALDPRQRPLDTAGLRDTALRRYGVLLETCSSADQLLAQVMLFPVESTSALSGRLPALVVRRLSEIGLPSSTIDRWLRLWS